MLPPEQQDRIEILQRSIEGLRGVAGCTVFTDPAGVPEEIDVLVSAYRPEKYWVTEIESICQGIPGYTPERCRVNISPMGDEVETALNRLNIARVEWTEDSGNARVLVELTDGKALFLGESASVVAGEDRLKLVARATAMAMEKYLASRCHLVTGDLVRFNIGRYQGTLVGIDFDSPDGKEQLIGSALIRKDEDEAIIKAILGAINRNILKKYGPAQEEVWNQEESVITME